MQVEQLNTWVGSPTPLQKSNLSLFEWQRLIRSSRLRPTSRLVALMLATRMDGDLECWPSYETLAYDCGFRSRSTAKRAVAELKRAGYLKVTYRGGRGCNLSNLFHATRPAWLG